MSLDWTAVALSVRLSAATTLVLLLVGLPVAYWVAFSTRRWKFLVEAVVALPLVLPPTVLGFYFLVATGPRSPLGRFVEGLTGSRLPFTFAGLLVASVLYSLPFAVQPFAAAFARVPRRLLEASFSLGVSRLGTFRRVIIPLSLSGDRDRPRSQLRPHDGGVRRRPDGGREPPGGDADGLDLDLRRRSGARLRRRRRDVASPSRLLVRRPRRDLRPETPGRSPLAFRMSDLSARFERRYPGGPSIRADLVLPLARADVTVLFGPSGAGKTTILRCLAGLDRPDAGVIRFGEETWFDAGKGLLSSAAGAARRRPLPGLCPLPAPDRPEERRVRPLGLSARRADRKDGRGPRPSSG